MPNEVKLLPCPFCGSEARTILSPDGWMIQCGGCDLQAGFDTTEEKSARYWNTRPTIVTDEVVERVAEALANQIGMRNGAPPIRGCLHLMPAEMAAKFRDDARAAIAAMPAIVGGE